jgi:multiple antibiotic resistance protein
MEMAKTLISAFLVTFAALFPIVNPIEGAPLYHVLTKNIPARRQRALARRVAVGATSLLLGSMLLGPWLLIFFGIELPVVRIVGGIVLVTLGWKLLTQEQWSDHSPSSVPHEAMDREGAFYPLTMPLTVGPGSMSVAIGIGSRKWGALNFGEFLLNAGGALAGLFAIGLSIYIAYRFSAALSRVLGASGVEVLVRMSAFILLCIGVEFLWSGYLALQEAHPHAIAG